MSRHKRYPVRIPRHARGIRAQEVRGGAEWTWWTDEWLRRLEGMGLKGRFGRARNYAVQGQVVSVEIEGNRVFAKVQGTRETPYEVKLDFNRPSSAALQRITAAIRAEPILVARMLADDLPLEVEEIFRREGCDLFPGGKLENAADGRKYDMISSCSCPDYANPCKHSCAVLMILGEEIARRPLTLLELRGISAEALCDED